jgi:hypothetical protein
VDPRLVVRLGILLRDEVLRSVTACGRPLLGAARRGMLLRHATLCGATLATALAAQAPQAPPLPPEQAPAPSLRVIDISVDVMGAAGGSTANNAELEVLQGGSHDPKQRGFTLQQAAVSLAGVVDPWFAARMHLVTAVDTDGETVVELEEAFVSTRQLPAGLELQAGTFLTEFGIVNGQHAHQWQWLDQPVINTRLFGGDGMRGPGARLSWAPVPHAPTRFVFGAQNAGGETMPSFLADQEVYEERPVGGRPFDEQDVHGLGDVAWTLRARTAFEVSTNTTFALGASGAFGPNATGGDTALYGADFSLRWQAVAGEHDSDGGHDHDHGFIEIQGEWSGRTFDADVQIDGSDPLNPVAVPGERLRDHGGYVHVLWGFARGWAAGVRAEYATGSGQVYDASTQMLTGRQSDPFAADRVRISPLLSYSPSPSSRIRLEYSFDDGDPFGAEHSVWIGFDVSLGSHGDHEH